MIVFLLMMMTLFPSLSRSQAPRVKFEHSVALDMYCPKKVVPEYLTSQQAALIPKIPFYQQELVSKLDWFQSQWDSQGTPLLNQTILVIGKTFELRDIQASVFLCPRLPSMGTPLALNLISYLESSAKDIQGPQGKPLPVFFFVSTSFHEVLHKYINDILKKQPSKILAQTKGTELYKAHLHVFAVQKLVFESLRLGQLLPQIRQLEALHGPDYAKAWNSVHGDPKLFQSLIQELKSP